MAATQIKIELEGSDAARQIKSSAARIHVSTVFRELIQNSIEAGATDINVVPSPMPTQGRSGAKVVFTDNGHGMTADEMRRYIGTIGKGACDSRGNHHMGSRIATLGVSGGVGVVFASWTTDNPDGAFILLKADGHAVTYESPHAKDGFVGKVPREWKFLKSTIIEKAGQGTSVMLLGNAEEDDTWGFTQNSNGKINVGIGHVPVGWLGLKFFDTMIDGERVRPRIRFARGADDKRKWLPASPTSNSRSFRAIKHAHDLLEENGTDADSHSAYIDTMGTFALKDDNGVHVADVNYVVGKDIRAEDMKYVIAFQAFGELYGGETYNLRYPFTDDKSGKDVTRTDAMFRSYGIVDASLRKRLILLIEPVNGTAHPNTERTHLEYTPASGIARDTLPHRAWGQIFIENMPEELRELQDLSARKASRKYEEERAKEDHAFRASLYGPHVVSASGRVIRGKSSQGDGNGEGKRDPKNSRGSQNKGPSNPNKKSGSSPKKKNGAEYVTEAPSGESFTVKDVESLLADPPSVELASESDANSEMFNVDGEAYGLTVYSVTGTVVVDDNSAWIDQACERITSRVRGRVTTLDRELLRAALVNLTVEDLRSYLTDIAYRITEKLGARTDENDSAHEEMWSKLADVDTLDLQVRSTSRVNRLSTRASWKTYGMCDSEDDE